MREILERIIIACEKVMSKAQDVRCHNECPDKIKVDMIQIYLEMSLMDDSIDQDSSFIIQLKDILHPLDKLTGNGGDQVTDKIKEEPEDFVVAEPSQNKRLRTENATGVTNQQVTQTVQLPEKRKHTTKKQMMRNTEDSTIKDFKNSSTLDFLCENVSVTPALSKEPLCSEKPKRRSADLGKLKDLTKGDVIWVKKPNGEEITCTFLKLVNIEAGSVHVETEERNGQNLKKKKVFLYLSVCQWGTIAADSSKSRSPAAT